MAKAQIKGVRIEGLHTTVGAVEKRIDDELDALGGDVAQLERIKKAIGLEKRRIAAPGSTSLDLGQQAVSRLLSELDVEATDCDALIFVTQTPDYFQPCNAAVLHGKLGMGKGAAAFDVNLGCSGYVYGLYLGHLMVAHGGCSKVMLVAADTISRIVNPRDRTVAPLFGDAGSATLLCASEDSSPAYFALHTDGSGWEAIAQPSGAFREPVTEASQKENTDAEGNTRARTNLHMNGADVFNFSIREEPIAIREILEYAELDAGQVDAFIFHQANRYIIGNIAKRLKIDPAQAPADTVSRYGNQSSASIPGAICDTQAQRLAEASLQWVLSGFGVGLSWASAAVQVARGTYAGLDIQET